MATFSTRSVSLAKTVGAAGPSPLSLASRPAGTNECCTCDDWRQRRQAPFLLQFLHAALETALQVVGPLTGLARVETRGLPRQLLGLEFLSSVVPVRDFLRESLLDCGHRLGDLFFLSVADLFKVARHELGSGVGDCPRLEILLDPRFLQQSSKEQALLVC